MKYILSILLLLFASVMFVNANPQNLNPEISILSECPDFDAVNEKAVSEIEENERDCNCNYQAIADEISRNKPEGFNVLIWPNLRPEATISRKNAILKPNLPSFKELRFRHYLS